MLHVKIIKFNDCNPAKGACEQSQKRFSSLVMKILNTTTNEHTSSVFIEYQDNKQWGLTNVKYKSAIPIEQSV